MLERRTKLERERERRVERLHPLLGQAAERAEQHRLVDRVQGVAVYDAGLSETIAVIERYFGRDPADGRRDDRDCGLVPLPTYVIA